MRNSRWNRLCAAGTSNLFRDLLAILGTIFSLGLACSILAPFCMAQPNSSPGVVLFWEDGFPSAEIPQLSPAQAKEIFAGYEVVGSEELASKLATARVLILPYGSAFPELNWPAIRSYLQRGGNLVVLGGRPFTRPVYRDNNGVWQVRPATQAFARELRIYGYQPTSGAGLAFTPNSDLTGPALPAFSWQTASSLTVRLSEKALDDREGSAGSLDAFLHPLAWGARDGHRLSAPAVEIDHVQNSFVGSRWELLTCDPGPDFWSSPSTKPLIRALLDRASLGASDFRVQPQYPVFAPGEPWRFELHWAHPGAAAQPLRIELTLESDHGKPRTEHFDFTPAQLPFEIGIELKPSANTAGLQCVTAKLFEAGHLAALYKTGFWMRDDALLRSGPLVTRDSNFLLIDGKPQPIVGTTYMATDVQREFFDDPNPYVWDRDMDQISSAGLNMLRTGWWWGWSRLADDGVATEKTLRTLEAYLLTARKHNLPVQFNLFAFTPPIFPFSRWPNQGPYFAHAASHEKFVRSVVERFHDVPDLMWDLINEPSFSNPARTWITRPTDDNFEQGMWNNWVGQRYGSLQAASNAWHVDLPNGLVQLPLEADFSARGALSGASPARAYDYNIFAQESFAAWAAQMRDAIRATGSKQLITVGQDEGGVTDRPMPAYFASAVDFTTNHTWWLNDALLWDSLAAKQPGMPLLIQETGIQHQSNLDGTPRLTDEEEAALLERKLAVALGTSAGAIQWLWNTNAYMMPEMELTIGALRPDGTEKPEADVLRRYAKFVHDSASLLQDPTPPEIVVVTSQALQFSPYGDQAIAAQQRAVRALHYDLHLSASVLAENQLDKLGNPKLVILPSPQALTQTAWERLVTYVRGGGHLLVTGPVERDEHGSAVHRITALSPGTHAEPLLSHYSELQFGPELVPLTFNAAAQQQLERLSLPQFVTDLPVENGHIYATADPVELAEAPEPTARLYRQIATVLELRPAYDLRTDTNSVLIRAAEMPEAVLYLFVSESPHDQQLALTDHKTGAELAFTLKAQRARLAVVRTSDHKIIWSPE